MGEHNVREHDVVQAFFESKHAKHDKKQAIAHINTHVECMQIFDNILAVVLYRGPPRLAACESRPRASFEMTLYDTRDW